MTAMVAAAAVALEQPVTGIIGKRRQSMGNERDREILGNQAIQRARRGTARELCSWHRQHECEWLLTPTTGYTYAVRRVSSGSAWTCGWYVWRHRPDESRELIAGGVTKSVAHAKKHARADWNARCEEAKHGQG